MPQIYQFRNLINEQQLCVTHVTRGQSYWQRPHAMFYTSPTLNKTLIEPFSSEHSCIRLTDRLKPNITGSSDVTGHIQPKNSTQRIQDCDQLLQSLQLQQSIIEMTAMMSATTA